MILVYNLAMTVFATLSFTFGISYYIREKNIGKMRLLISLMGVATGMCNTGYVLLSFSDISPASLIFRNIGMLGISFYLVLEYYLCFDMVTVNPKLKNIYVHVGVAILLAAAAVHALPDSVEFYKDGAYTSFVSTSFWGNYAFIAGEYILIMLMLFYGTKWFLQQKTYRERVFVGLIWLSNFFFLISAVPYYVGVQLSHPSFAYCLGNTGAYFFIWLAGIRFSGFTVTEQSLGSEIFKSVNFGIVILDYNGKLSLINRYARAHLNVAKIEGQSLDKLFDITSEDIEELFSEIDTSDILERKWKAIDGEKIFNVDITTKRDKKGDIICIIIAIADITREEEMILKITSADREKSEFLKRIAHEVRTPLNTILGMDRLIIRKSKDEELSAYAKDINKAGQTMLSLINDAFNISEEAIEEINYSEFNYDELEDNNGEPEYFSAPEAKILVVDDIDMNLNVFKGILKVTEIDVRTASSGAEAIELIKAEPFDIIFMDHMMPVMDGVECMQIIRRSKDHPNVNTPIIVLTANAIAGAREEYMGVGFDDYFTKPIRENEILRVVKKYLKPDLIKEYVSDSVKIETNNEAVVNLGAIATPVDSFISKMEKISEIDYKLGLSYCMQSEDFYKEMIGSYLDGSKYSSMEEFYAANDLDNYRITVHALKSTSLSIGASKLSEEAKALEYAAKDGDVDYIKNNHERVRAMYAELLKKLRNALSENDVDEADTEIEKIDISNARILVVDDDIMNLKIARFILEKKFTIIEANSGKQCFEQLKENEVDLILLDIHMPEMDGYEVLKEIRSKKEYDSIPVIFLSADEDIEAESKGLEEGALDFIKKPFNAEVALKRIERVLELSYLQKYLEQEVSRQTEAALDGRLHAERLFSQFIQTMSNSIDAKDKYTNGHSTRVAKYSVMIAKRMGYDDNLHNVEYIGLLHDIGKIGIPDEIINKPSGLTDEEYAIIKNHPIIGHSILKNVTEIPDLSIGARWHHEKYDGTGYPDGLKGEEIPEIARIVGVADAYDTMASKRSYRDILPQDKIVEEIKKFKGTQFDPKIADIMLEIISEDVNYELHE